MSHASAAVTKVCNFVLLNAEWIGYALFFSGTFLSFFVSGAWILFLALPLQLVGIALFGFQFFRKNKARKAFNESAKALKEHWKDYDKKRNDLWKAHPSSEQIDRFFEEQDAKYDALQKEYEKAKERLYSLK